MPRSHAWLGLIVALALASPAIAAPPSSRSVRLAPIEGLPPDAPSRNEFLANLRSAFESRSLTIIVNGELAPLEHDFALEDSARGLVWDLQIVVGAPPLLRDVVRDRKGRLVSQKPNGRRASRGLTLVIAALSPEAVEAGARPMPQRIGLVLPDLEGSAASQAVTRGVDYRWDQAGLAVGRVALEALLHAAGEGPEGEWVADLAPVMRLPSPR